MSWWVLAAALQIAGGFHLPDVWLGALLSLAVTGITVGVGLQLQQRAKVERVDTYLFGDGRNQRGIAVEWAETLPKLDRAVEKVDELCEWKEGFAERDRERAAAWEAKWESFLRQQRTIRRRGSE